MCVSLSVCNGTSRGLSFASSVSCEIGAAVCTFWLCVELHEGCCCWKGLSILTGQFVGAGQEAVACPCNKTCTRREEKEQRLPTQPCLPIRPPNQRGRHRERERVSEACIVELPFDGTDISKGTAVESRRKEPRRKGSQ